MASTETGWSERLGWSAGAAIAAAMLVMAAVVAVAFADDTIANGLRSDLLGHVGMALGFVAFGGIALGLVMTVPVCLASFWAARHRRGGALGLGAGIALLVGFAMLGLASDTGFMLFCGALGLAVLQGGVFFATRLDVWAGEAPCAS